MIRGGERFSFEYRSLSDILEKLTADDIKLDTALILLEIFELREELDKEYAEIDLSELIRIFAER